MTHLGHLRPYVSAGRALLRALTTSTPQALPPHPLTLTSTPAAPLPRQGFTVGTYESSDKQISLEIGNHTLQGKLQALPKPQLILERTTAPDGATHLTVRGVLRHKAVFSSKPRAIISSAP